MLENIDCLAHMLSYLSVRERESCRSVCLNWLISADELARTQQSLVIVGQRRDQPKNNNEHSSSAEERTGLEGRRRNFLHSGSSGHQLNAKGSSRSLISWPQNYIRYHCFCQMMGRFPNVKSLTFEGIEHWNDHLLDQLAAACPQLTSLAFVRCVGLGRRIFQNL